MAMKVGSRGAGIGVLVLSLVVVGTGVADAATGGALVLGQRNKATATTTVVNTKGAPLALVAGRGAAPLAVNSHTKVRNLNADEVDGLDSAQLQRRVGRSCTAGSAIRSISASGQVTCQTAAGSGGTYSSALAALSQGIGIAYCPAGSSPLGGGVVPDSTGLTDLPYVVADVVHVTNDVFDGWEAIVADTDGSYNGTGYVYVTCTTAAVTPIGGSTVSPAQVAKTARIARAQFQARH